MSSRKEILALLVQYDLDMSAKTPDGRNLLHQFVSEYVKEFDQDAAGIAEILLIGGIPVDEVDNDGYSPLILAIYEGNAELIKFLIAQGADLNKRIKNGGVFPLALAVRVGKRNIVELLLDMGANIDAADFEGLTALHTACTHNREQMIELLIRRCASVAAEEVGGRTPLLYLNPKMKNFNDCTHIMMKEISQIVFDQTSFSEKDIMLMLEIPVARDQFESCMIDLEQMAEKKFYESYSFYSVLKMSKNIKEFALLLKNEDFVDGFMENMSDFRNYENDFTRILEEGFLMYEG